VCAEGTSSARANSRFDGADLTDARFGGVDLTGCIYSDETRFPRAFNPRHARMVHVRDIEELKSKTKNAPANRDSEAVDAGGAHLGSNLEPDDQGVSGLPTELSGRVNRARCSCK
jgi:uncharacterized protein YjbI with pentapeptide repeats